MARRKEGAREFLKRIGDGVPLVGQEPKKILVNMGCYRFPNPKTVLCMNQMLAHFAEVGKDREIIYRIDTGSELVAMRNMAFRVMAEDPTFEAALFVDDDMEFPVGAVSVNDGDVKDGFNPLERLLARDKEIIGGLCTSRRQPIKVFAGWQEESGMVRLANTPEHCHPENGDLFEVDYTGFGFLLVRREAVLKMLDFLEESDKFCQAELMWRFLPEAAATLQQLVSQYAASEASKSPFESTEGRTDGPEGPAMDRLMDGIDRMLRKAHELSEDFSFCRKAKLAGCEIWIDPSFQVKHIGDYGYSLVDWLGEYNWRKEQEAAEAAAGG